MRVADNSWKVDILHDLLNVIAAPINQQLARVEGHLLLHQYNAHAQTCINATAEIIKSLVRGRILYLSSWHLGKSI